jgi:hypothetical protein
MNKPVGNQYYVFPRTLLNYLCREVMICTLCEFMFVNLICFIETSVWYHTKGSSLIFSLLAGSPDTDKFMWTTYWQLEKYRQLSRYTSKAKRRACHRPLDRGFKQEVDVVLCLISHTVIVFTPQIRYVLVGMYPNFVYSLIHQYYINNNQSETMSTFAKVLLYIYIERGMYRSMYSD